MSHYGLQNLKLFRTNLILILLLVTSLLSLFVMLLSYTEIIVLSMNSRYVLLFFFGVCGLCFFILKKYPDFYHIVANVFIYSSLMVFTLLTILVTNDAFRIIWFFFTSFGTFIFYGRLYGVLMNMLIVVILIFLYHTYNLKFSFQTIFTFCNSMFLFTIFCYFFILKIENDAKTFESKIEEEVQRRVEQEKILLKNHRMQNMGQMIDAIAHQWRQPLHQSSFGLLNIAKKVDDKAINKKIAKLLALNEHMSQTISDFREFLHEDKALSLFNISKVVVETLHLIHHSFMNIEVNYDKMEKDLHIKSYKNELIQVFIILFFNVVEAFNKKKRDKKLTLYSEVTNASIILFIEDNAGGIDETILPKIFDPYFSTKKRDGSGLGLYIARVIVENSMRGELSVKNGKEGAIFMIKLPKK